MHKPSDMEQDGLSGDLHALADQPQILRHLAKFLTRTGDEFFSLASPKATSVTDTWAVVDDLMSG